MRDTFSAVAPYLRDDRQMPWFSEFGPQQSRAFRALKLWLGIKQIGVEGYRYLISRDIELARLLRQKILARPDFELLSDGPISVTCFRYHPAGVADLDAFNRRVMDIVQRKGDVYMTSTQLNGVFTLRANIINFRTSESDLDFLLDAVAQAGKEALAGG
jgi:glutamate/tyrosine decarboxylase-like PLP-dependent enzyme